MKIYFVTSIVVPLFFSPFAMGQKDNGNVKKVNTFHPSNLTMCELFRRRKAKGGRGDEEERL